MHAGTTYGGLRWGQPVSQQNIINESGKPGTGVPIDLRRSLMMVLIFNFFFFGPGGGRPRSRAPRPNQRPVANFDVHFESDLRRNV